MACLGAVLDLTEMLSLQKCEKLRIFAAYLTCSKQGKALGRNFSQSRTSHRKYQLITISSYLGKENTPLQMDALGVHVWDLVQPRIPFPHACEKRRLSESNLKLSSKQRRQDQELILSFSSSLMFSHLHWL